MDDLMGKGISGNLNDSGEALRVAAAAKPHIVAV
jgi:hypothetical protein